SRRPKPPSHTEFEISSRILVAASLVSGLSNSTGGHSLPTAANPRLHKIAVMNDRLIPRRTSAVSWAAHSRLGGKSAHCSPNQRSISRTRRQRSLRDLANSRVNLTPEQIVVCTSFRQRQYPGLRKQSHPLKRFSAGAKRVARSFTEPCSTA